MDAPKRIVTLRRRLWLGWFCLAVLILTLLVGNRLVQRERAVTRNDFGLDFIVFYRAGVLLNQGHAADLYSIPLTQKFDHALAEREGLPLGDNYGPYFYPPFLAWIFVPIANLSYHGALLAWEMVSLGCFGFAAVLLCRIIPGRPNGQKSFVQIPRRSVRDWALVPALIMVSLPFIQTIGHGQNTCLSLLLATLAVVMWRKKQGFWAGCAVGFLCYKPQLAAVILAVLVLSVGWRALAGAATSGGLLLLICLITLPGSVSQYIHTLAPNVELMLSTHQHVWQRHVTLKAFWLVLLPALGVSDATALAPRLAIACGVPLVAGLALCIWRNRGSASPDRLIASTIAVMPLLMPYYLDYDLLLLALPAVLFAADIISRDAAKPLPQRDVWLIRLWIGLFAVLLVNPGLTSLLKFNLAVPMLAATAVLLMARACDMTVPYARSTAAGKPDRAVVESIPWPVAVSS